MYKKIFLISVLFAAFIFTGCKNEEDNGNAKQENTDGGTALRKGDLFSEDINLGQKAVVDALTGTIPFKGTSPVKLDHKIMR